MAEVHPAVKKIQEKFPSSAIEAATFRGEVNVTVLKKDIFEICRFLYTDSDLQYHMLTDLC
ncbi:MAG: NADH-quinone oxidoreductase subunit C, partial [Deltaproteobacteria bacterium]|nr:NADH-quinone oxidoreductase subunit C [Deltaproteobacteria bacterium]